MLNLEKSVSSISFFSAFIFPALLILRAADLISPGHASLCAVFPISVSLTLGDSL